MEAMRIGRPALGRAAAWSLIACLLVSPVAEAAEGDASPAPSRADNKAEAERRLSALKEKHADDDAYLFRPGLYASHADREVHIFAEAAEVSIHDPIEFFLIGEKSGHDYEALAISLAKPSDVDAALQFIGVKPGKAIDFSTFRMWPKGDPVAVSVLVTGKDGKTVEHGVGELLVDDRTDATFAQTAFLFVGSREIPDPDIPDSTVYSADVQEPNSIAANYNEPRTVLDVPVQRSKGEQYRHLSRNPDLQLTPGDIVVFRIRPLAVADHPHPRDLVVEVGPVEDVEEAATEMERIELSLHTAGGELISADESFPGLLAGLEKVAAGGGLPYVEVRFNPALPLGDVKTACRALSELEGNDGIRIEPPPAGHAYYKAFMPREDFRTPQGRPSQPWEIHLKAGGEGMVVEAVLTRADFGEDIMNPTYTSKTYPVESAKAIGKRLAEIEEEVKAEELMIPRVLIFFVPTGMAYGDLTAIMSPLLAECPIVYVFGDDRPSK